MFGPLDLAVPGLAIIGSGLSLPFALVLHPISKGFKHAWFRAFWSWFGPASKPIFKPSVTPLLTHISGVVVDVGPGNGVWLEDVAKAIKKDPSRITRIYGVEPNPLFHRSLIQRVKALGIEGIYVPICGRIQDLESYGIKKGTVDTILTIHVLCSVGNHLDDLVKQLYAYLKPGGQWVVYEHVIASSGFTRLVQRIHNVVWPTFFDGCDMMRDTEKCLRRAGDWESVAVGPDPREGFFDTLPHTVGFLVKSKK